MLMNRGICGLSVDAEEVVLRSAFVGFHTLSANKSAIP